MPQVVERLQYPLDTELRVLDPIRLNRVAEAEPVFRYFPLRETQYGSTLTWRVRDTAFGLQHARTYNEPFPRVTRRGAEEFTIRSGLYGEHVPIEERELTERSNWAGTAAIPINDLVQDALEITQDRQIARQANSCWTLITTGRHVIRDEFGTVLDEYSFDIIEMDATDWTNTATGEPFGDLLDVMEVPLGTSVSFSGAPAFATRRTTNYAIRNTNTNDLGGKRALDGSTLSGLDDVNRIFSRNGMPTLVAYDGGHDDEAGNFSTHIPDNKVVIVGMVPGETIGEYRMTRNANNPDRSSRPYLKIIDTAVDPNGPPPRRMEIYRGHNGGPILMRPSAVIVMHVGP